MEVFNVLATMNLVDGISSPLGRINSVLGTTTEKVDKMSDVIGSANTKAMLPLAIASGAVVASLGACVKEAVAFESSMADVAKVVNFTSETELKGMEKAILDMSTKIPMAADGIAAIIASAAQSGVAKKDLTQFAEQAAKMGVAFDLTGDQAGKMMANWRSGMGLTLEQTYSLADAVNHLSNNMNAAAPALGEVLQRAGALGIMAGGLETEVAALGTAFLTSGAAPDVAATALKNFTGTLTQGTAMTDAQAAAFKSLGFDAVELAKRMQVDAKGAIFDVLNALAKMPKYMHGAMLTQMFGKESIGAIAPLLKNMNTLSQAFNLVSDKSKYAGSMQAEFETRSKTVANAVQLLQNKIIKLKIVIGNYLLPAVSVLIEAFGGLVGGITFLAQTPVGKFFVETAGAISAAALAAGGFFLAMKVGRIVLSFLTNGLMSLKNVFLGLSLPMQGLIVMAGLLYLAYKTNLGGIADKINAFYTKAKIVFQAVFALLANFKDGSASIGGELAKQIRDNGLGETVTVLFKVFRRLHAFASGVFEGISMSFMIVGEIFGTVFKIISYPVEKLIDLLSALGLAAADTGNVFKTDTIKSIGAVIGVLASAAAAVKLVTAAKKTWLFVSLRLGAVLKSLVLPVKKLGNALKATMLFMKAGAIKAWAFAVSFATKTVNLLVLGARGLGIALKTTMLFMKAGAIKAWAFAVSFATKAINLLALGVRGLGIAFKFAAANPLIIGIAALIAVIVLVIKHFDTIKETVVSVFSAAWDYISNFGANLLNYWNSLRNTLVAPFLFAFETIKTVFGGIWDFISGLFSGKSLYESGAALINTLKEGILSAWNGLKESFTDVLASLREMLPFSDAKTGPLSTLTLSGNRLISTLGEGVQQAAPAFIKDVNGVFSQINPAFGSFSYASDFVSPLIDPKINVPDIDAALAPYLDTSGTINLSAGEPVQTTRRNTEKMQNSYTVHIQNITLPNVQNADDFIKQLENELVAYGA